MPDAQNQLDELLGDVELSSRARGRFREVEAFLAELCGLEDDQVYVAYVSGGSKNARNRAQQAKKEDEFVLLILDTPESLESSANNVSYAVEEGDVQAVALAVEADDGCPIERVLARSDSPLRGKLGDAFPAATVESIGDEGPPELPSFSATDCDLFARTGGKPWDEVSDEDKQHGREITARLKQLAEATAGELGGALTWDAAVSRHLKQPAPTQPTAHKDIWCCVVPSDAPAKSHALQVALIIKAEGAEMCFCLGSGESRAKSFDASEAAAAYESVRQRLAALPPELIEQLDDAVGGWDLRKHWREPETSDFDEIDDWLVYAASDQGPEASISRDIDVDELDSSGSAISQAFVELAKALVPIFDFVYREKIAPPVSKPLTVEAVQAAAPELVLDDEIVAALVAALESGKHVVLTGPPGTGKTTLAEAACRAAKEVGRTTDYLPTTATSDWTTYETIGGLRPTNEGLQFKEGHLLEAVRKEQWLLVDELNRAPFDQAFGQLFTVLSGQPVVLPYEDPLSGDRISIVPAGRSAPQGTHPVKVASDWRMVATMNVFDKDLLFEMSYALMRRFAFVDVPAPPDHVYEDLIDQDSEDDPVAAEVAKSLLAVRGVKEIGPASFRDMTRFLVERRTLGGISGSRLTSQAFFAYLLPQFEGIDADSGVDLMNTLGPLLTAEDRSAIARTISDVLGIDLDLLIGAPASETESEGEDY